jgi:hypothetical protein
MDSEITLLAMEKLQELLVKVQRLENGTEANWITNHILIFKTKEDSKTAALS